MNIHSPFVGNTPRTLEALQAWTERSSEPPLDPQQAIIDSHHHLFDDERGRFLIPEMLAEIESGHNIIATVFLQHKTAYLPNGPEALKPVGEVAFAAEIARATANDAVRLCDGIVGHADLSLGNDVVPVLEALTDAGEGRLKGIRHGATWDAGRAGYGRSFARRNLLISDEFRKGFAHLSGFGLSFDAWIFHPQLPDLIDLLKAFPDTPVVLNHCGGILGVEPHTDCAAVFELWKGYIETLAQFPNLSVKAGGLGMLYSGNLFYQAPEPPSSLALAQAWQPYIDLCIEAFGPSRVMFESNFPVDKQSCGYGALWNAFQRITAHHSATEKNAMFYNTARDFYRLDLPRIV